MPLDQIPSLLTELIDYNLPQLLVYTAADPEQAKEGFVDLVFTPKPGRTPVKVTSLEERAAHSHYFRHWGVPVTKCVIPDPDTNSESEAEQQFDLEDSDS